MSSLGALLYLILPLVLAGITNMVWMKLPLGQQWRVPMDGGRLLADGERLFGDNKTWKGFWGMVGASAFWLFFFEQVGRLWPHTLAWSLFPFNQWYWGMGLIYGGIWGLFYVLFELPNSCLKRRLKIPPGQTVTGWTGRFFMVLDQSDSVLGCLIGLWLFYPLGWVDAVAILVLATGIHFLTNLLLYLVGLKKQAG